VKFFKDLIFVLEYARLLKAPRGNDRELI